MHIAVVIIFCTAHIQFEKLATDGSNYYVAYIGACITLFSFSLCFVSFLSRSKIPSRFFYHVPCLMQDLNFLIWVCVCRRLDIPVPHSCSICKASSHSFDISSPRPISRHKRARKTTLFLPTLKIDNAHCGISFWVSKSRLIYGHCILPTF